MSCNGDRHDADQPVSELKPAQADPIDSDVGVILSWIPPLVFTTINEISGNLRLGMIRMIGFLLMGFLLSLTIPETSIEKYSHKSTKEVQDQGENDDEKADADSAD